jgi:alkylation response protein AidB-like acyl-CoA dehydrogenase
MMDFELSEDQAALRDLAEGVVAAHAPLMRPRDEDPGGTQVNRELWAALAAADLLRAPLPVEAGGLGLGVVEACVVLEVLGRFVAPVPYLESIVMGAMPLAAFGGPAQHDLVRAIADGSALVTAAVHEDWWSGVRDPRVSARRDRSGWRIEGVKEAVPYAPLADHMVLSVQTDEGARLCVVDASHPAVEVRPEVSTSHQPMGRVHFDGVPVAATDVLAGDGQSGDVVGWAYRHALAGICATAVGVMRGGLQLTARYIAQREQFGRPIASFQGAAMRIADAYIDTEAVVLATWSAVWRLATGRSADDELAIAKFWVADGGQRAVHAFQHLHGGIGVDETYPAHRYFTWAKGLEMHLGGATQQLLALGSSLATGEAPDVH